MKFKYADVHEQYEKNKRLKREDIVLLDEWLQKQPHLPPLSELELIFFLHSCYFSTEKAKAVIENYFTIKTLSPEFFGKKHHTEFEATINQAVYVPLPKLTPEGYLIVYCKLINCSPQKFIFSNHVKYGDSHLKMYLLEHGVVEGLAAIMDLEGLSFGHLTRMPLLELKKAFHYLQEALPVRLKVVHCINVGPSLDRILALIKPLMKLELFNLIHFHTDNLKTIHKYIPQELLPKDFGGSVDSVADLHGATKKRITENADFIKYDEERLADDSKRQGKCTNVDALFGIEGSFKKLEID